MSHHPPSRARSGNSHDHAVADEQSIDDLLDALEDRDCRAILQATADESLSASELAEVCDLPLSTAYRKVDKLAEAGLLDEQIRLCTSGKHTSEYTLLVDSIELAVDPENGVTVQISSSKDLGLEAPGGIIAGAD